MQSILSAQHRDAHALARLLCSVLDDGDALLCLGALLARHASESDRQAKWEQQFTLELRAHDRALAEHFARVGLHHAPDLCAAFFATHFQALKLANAER